MQKKKSRQSNIELLRILAACGVIALHYNNADMGGGFSAVKPWSANQLVLMFLESVFVCAVDLFVLISGYFMAKKKSADLIKPIDLIVRVIAYSAAFYLVMAGLGVRQFSIKGFAMCFIPNNWFVILYAALFVISPYLNLFLRSLDVNQKKKFLLVTAALFFVYPTLTDMFSLWTNKEIIGISSIGMYGTQQGYTIINFVLMYSIGNYLREVKPGKQAKQLALLALVALMIFGWSLLDNAMHHSQHSSWAYCNPLVVTEAILIFQIFRNIKIKDNRVINRLAAGSFSAYILHTKVIGSVKAESFVNQNIFIMLAHILACCVVIYLISWIVHEVYSLITKPIIGIISKHWKKLRVISV